MIQASNRKTDVLVSVVIVTWNCRDYVMRCLESVFTNYGVDFGIIVRDNGSEDGTVQAIQCAFPTVHLVGDRTNVGFAAANNEAILHAKGEYLLLLNPDTEIPSNAFAELVSVAQRHGNRVVVVPTLLNSDRTVQPSLHSFPTIASIVRDNIVAVKKLLGVVGEYRPNSSVEWAKGACLFVPLALHQVVGDLDERLFMYGEDMDYCWRVHKAGFGIVWAPQIHVIHHGNVSGVQKWGSQRMVKTNQSLIYFWMKHFGLLYTLTVVCVKILALLTQAIGNCLRGIIGGPNTHNTKSKERFRQSFALLRACFDRSAWRFYHSALQSRG